MSESIGDTFKVVVLGEARVGKTSLTCRFCLNTFDDQQKSTLNAAYLEQTVRVPEPAGGHKVHKLSIWDTAGQEAHRSLNTIYYRGAQGAVIVYDITDLDSFGRMQEWMRELRTQLGDKVPIVVVGNKCDLESNRQVEVSKAEAEAKKFGGVHYSASARTGHAVKEVFRGLTERIAAFRRDQKKTAGGRKLNTRGMMNVKGIDVNDDDNDFAGPRAFQLRPSIGDNNRPDKKKKKKGCSC